MSHKNLIYVRGYLIKWPCEWIYQSVQIHVKFMTVLTLIFGQSHACRSTVQTKIALPWEKVNLSNEINRPKIVSTKFNNLITIGNNKP